MKVAVSASGPDLDATIDPRFGRCAYFVIVDTDDMNFEAFDNDNIALGGGAGIQSAQFVASKGANVVLTGNCGPNAVQTLSAAGVEVDEAKVKTLVASLQGVDIAAELENASVVTAAPAAAPAEAKAEEKKEEKHVESAAGLSSLFG